MVATLLKVVQDFWDTYTKKTDRRREFQIEDECRPGNHQDILVDAQRFVPRIMAGLDSPGIEELVSWLSRTYSSTGRQRRTIDIGKSGSKEVYSFIIPPVNDESNRLGLRVKYAVNAAGMAELWKEASAAAQLFNTSNLLGYSTVRDWTSDKVIINGEWVPFYIVEVNGTGNLKAVLESGENSARGAEAAIDLFRKFSWDNLKADGETQAAAREFMNRVFASIEKYVEKCPQELRTRRVPEYDRAKSRFVQLMSDSTPVAPVAVDPKPENIIYLNGNGYHLQWTDQGWEQSLYGPRINSDIIRRANFGLPQVPLGMFVMGLHRDLVPNIPEVTVSALKSKIESLSVEGRPKTKDSDEVPTFNEDLAQSALTLGQLHVAIRKENQFGYGGPWTRIVDSLIHNLYERQFVFTP